MRTRPLMHARLAALAVPAIAAFLAGCEEQNAYVPPPPPKVTVVQPTQKTVTEEIEFTGNIAATMTVQLRARVEGYLEKVLFDDGDRVEEGDLLFVIQQADYQAKVDAAKADVARVEAALEIARLTLNRLSSAGESGAVSKQQIDEAAAKVRVEEAELLAVKAALEQAELDLSYTKVHAPFDGRMGRRLVDPGNLVGGDGDTVLAEINQIDSVYAYFTINERDLMRITGREDRPDPQTETRQGTQKLYLGLINEDGFPHEGVFDFAAISLDADTGTLELRGEFPNPDRKILPGLFVRIRAPIGEIPDALLVPGDAIGFDQQGPYVYVVNDQNSVERRGVVMGQKDGDMRVIEKGIDGSERIVARGVARVFPGREVEPVEAPEAGTAQGNEAAPVEGDAAETAEGDEVEPAEAEEAEPAREVTAEIAPEVETEPGQADEVEPAAGEAEPEAADDAEAPPQETAGQ